MRTYDLGPKPLPISRNKKVITNFISNLDDLNLDDARRWITWEKANATKNAMARLAKEGKWPTDHEDVRAYIGNTDNNRFKNVGGFFAYMSKNPQLYTKRWRFEPTSVMDARMLKAAGDYIFRQARSNQVSTTHIKTGLMREGYMYLVKEKEGDIPKIFFGDLTVTRETEIWIANPVEYASSVEAHSFARVRTGGILSQAAKQATKKFRGLKIQYTTTSLDKLGLPMLHKYAVPIVRVGFRGRALKGKITNPGRNIRRRGSAYRRTSPHSGEFYKYQAARRLDRKNAGYKRQDGRHFGDDLFSYYSQRRRKK